MREEWWGKGNFFFVFCITACEGPDDIDGAEDQPKCYPLPPFDPRCPSRQNSYTSYVLLDIKWALLLGTRTHTFHGEERQE